ncbi:hypothetical protein [Acinetobacter boissieri]|uniref:Uncharacterized protein n=1 Tax=Acinetobacter boissieri TaxID=1219383 RepID=A0A1G6H5W3_9GAMM|nr:hypothetical protein [Acinetobacter boissieri]SDB88826.1 hypothetical protein SAMN05421733_103253 [Acinetobacter boissieri]
MVNCIRKELCPEPFCSFIDGFTFDQNGLIVIRYSTAISQVVHFKDSLYFNIIDEGDALQQHGEDKEEDPNTEVRLKYWFYVYDDSTLIDWFNEQTNNTYKGTFKHYFIYSHNEMVEVLSRFEPEISFKESIKTESHEGGLLQ